MITEQTTMNTTRGYYSLVQYCPDLARQEAANAGVVLFCPERGFFRAKLTDSLAHIRRFFGHAADTDGHIAGMLKALVSRIEIEQADFKSLEDLQQFVATRANKVILTPPKPVLVSEPEADLEALFRELVADPEDVVELPATLPLHPKPTASRVRPGPRGTRRPAAVASGATASAE